MPSSRSQAKRPRGRWPKKPRREQADDRYRPPFAARGGARRRSPGFPRHPVQPRLSLLPARPAVPNRDRCAGGRHRGAGPARCEYAAGRRRHVRGGYRCHARCAGTACAADRLCASRTRRHGQFRRSRDDPARARPQLRRGRERLAGPARDHRTGGRDREMARADRHSGRGGKRKRQPFLSRDHCQSGRHQHRRPAQRSHPHGPGRAVAAVPADDAAGGHGPVQSRGREGQQGHRGSGCSDPDGRGLSREAGCHARRQSRRHRGSGAGRVTALLAGNASPRCPPRSAGRSSWRSACSISPWVICCSGRCS